MDRDELIELFDTHDNKYLDFEGIENPPSSYRDLCGLLKLSQLLPSRKPGQIVTGAGHEAIYIRCDLDKLAKVATEDDIIYLIRCGIRYDEDGSALMMLT